jgi:DNA-binding transcriptional LysR family regulator
MRIGWLEDFLRVAETGHFCAAAEARCTSQLALSQHIQALEAWLGVALIDRSQYPTVLTPEGERLCVHAIALVQQMAEARSRRGASLSTAHT